MIPRQLDLVPEIRGPLSNYDEDAETEAVAKVNSESCSNRSIRQEMTRSVERFVLMPMTSNGRQLTNQYNNTHSKRESVNSNVELPSLRSLQLVSFISSPECVDAPIELMEMSSRRFTREEDFSGVDDDDNNENDDDDDDRSGNNLYSERNNRISGQTNNNSHNREREESVIYKKQSKKSILRSIYRSVRPTNSHRFSSIPLPEYEEFTPILLHWPATDTATNNNNMSSETTKTTKTSSSAANQMEICQMEILESPVIELRCERAEGVGSQSSLRPQQSISSNWLSSQTTKIKKADWKNMDAYDKEVGKVSRWSMEEALDDDDNDVHYNKASKSKANNTKGNANKFTSTASNNFVNRVSKNEKNARGVLKRARDSAFALQSRIQIPRLHNNTLNTLLTDVHGVPNNYNNTFNDFTVNKSSNNAGKYSLSTNKTPLEQKHFNKQENVDNSHSMLENKNEVDKTITQDRNVTDSADSLEALMPPPTTTSITTRRNEKHKNTIKLTSTPLVEEEYSNTISKLNIINTIKVDDKAQENCEDKISAKSSNQANKDNIEELDKCATVVLDELRASGKESASLKELERLILKKLPDYAMVAEKSRNSATKAEAVKWFHIHQQQLKEWLLVKQKYIIDKTGKVYFA